MVRCKSCGSYIKQGSKFCGYCGTEILCAAKKMVFTYAVEVEVRWETYKSQGIEKRRVAFLKRERYNEATKIGTFVPDFAADIEAAWLVDEDRILMLTRTQNIVKLRETKVNKKSSKEICTILQQQQAGIKEEWYGFGSISETEFLLLTRIRSDYECRYLGIQVYRICKNEVTQYPMVSSVDTLNITSFYTDGTILAEGGGYLLKPDGTVKKAADFYDQQELLERYHKKCKAEDQYTDPEVFWEKPYIADEMIYPEKGYIFVEIVCGRHEETLQVGMDGTLPIEDRQFNVLPPQDWAKEKEDILYLQKLARKDEPTIKLREELVAFERFRGKDLTFLYGTAKEEQFVYACESRILTFFPPKRHNTRAELIEFSSSYVKEHPQAIFKAKQLEAMHLLDHVSEKIIKAQEQRLQPFFDYMKAVRQYAALEKGDEAYQDINYTMTTFMEEFDLLAGVGYTDQEGKKWIAWKDQEALYTDQATMLLVRLCTDKGRKIFQIPLLSPEEFVVNRVFMTDDVKAEDRGTWRQELYDKERHKWEAYGERKGIPQAPVPYSNRWEDSFANNKSMLEEQGFDVEKYSLPRRPDQTHVDLMYQKEGPDLKPDDYVNSIAYKGKTGLKIPVDYLTKVHLLTLTQSGIFYLKGQRLYFRDVQNQEKVYPQSFRDTTRLFASGKYLFIEQIVGYQNTGEEVDTYGGYGLDTYFKVQYSTVVIEQASGRQVAVWKDMDEITSVGQYQNDIIIIKTASKAYQLYENEQSMKNMENWSQRSRFEIH